MCGLHSEVVPLTRRLLDSPSSNFIFGERGTRKWGKVEVVILRIKRERSLNEILCFNHPCGYHGEVFYRNVYVGNGL